MPRQRPMFSGTRARRFRTERDLSREQVAVAVGRSAETVQLWELGHHAPPMPMVWRLAEVLDVHPVDLFVGGDR